MKLRCVWCGATLTEDRLRVNEKGTPAYCPICGRSQFDSRPNAGMFTAACLRNTWKRQEENKK